jgi:hypothetical protein
MLKNLQIRRNNRRVEQEPVIVHIGCYILESEVLVNMSTLVCFASGAVKPEYESLPFDEIYLIDSEYFRNNSKELKDGNREVFQVGKITCIGLECLKAVDYLKSKNVKVDCYAAVNSGCYDSAKRCPLGSPYFIGYMMPILDDNYVHITNLEKYYGSTDANAMGLPYEMKQLTKNDKRYVDPKILTTNKAEVEDVEVFQMSKIREVIDLVLDSEVKVSVVRDSVWNYYDDVDLVVHSISDFERRKFFDRKPRVITWNHINESKRVYCLYSLSEKVWRAKFEIGKDLDAIFSYCVKNKINKVAFTPWGTGNYNTFLQKLQTYSEKYPKEITLFHLNKDDYKEIIKK